MQIYIKYILYLCAYSLTKETVVPELRLFTMPSKSLILQIW